MFVKIVDNRSKRKCASDQEPSAAGLRRRFRRIPKDASPVSAEWCAYCRHVQKRIYSLRHERTGEWPETQLFVKGIFFRYSNNLWSTPPPFLLLQDVNRLEVQCFRFNLQCVIFFRSTVFLFLNTFYPKISVVLTSDADDRTTQ